IDKQDNSLIELKETLDSAPREPDAVAWIGQGAFATANEGDMLGGSRGFTIYNPAGRVMFDVGNAFEHLAVRHGHYQEGRSDNKGTEPEGIEYAVFGRERLLFVGAERAGFVAVYRLGQVSRPELLQILPTGIGPEGLLAIPQRNLFAVANEVDRTPSALDRLAGFRSVISLYELRSEPASYPTIVSADRQGPGIAEAGGLPIPWAALSALAGDRQNANRLYTAHDSFFVKSRLYTVDVGQTPAVIDGEIVLKTTSGQTVNYDVEGVVQRANGGFWIVSEGAATAAARPNLLAEVAANGTIVNEVRLPAAVEALQRQFGFEGVAVTGSDAGEKVYVAFQREWVNDPANQVRIGVYTPADDTWRFFYYPIEPKNPAFTDAWVGLSELVALDDETFAVIERDNLIGEEAVVKRLYTFSIAGLTPKTQAEGGFPLVTKTLARDILPDLQGPQGSVMDKPEGLTVAADGEVYLVTDNDGVNNAPGETQFLRLGDREAVFGE
ncbi:MAG: esterase-like activity of phytase family protein, partial [Rhodospirillales bacterium]|nr:esterase-like activity of phytase family protein [Rhodospirillales bacterium]